MSQMLVISALMSIYRREQKHLQGQEIPTKESAAVTFLPLLSNW